MIWRFKEGLSRERVDGKMSQGEELLVKREGTIEREKKEYRLATAYGLEGVGKEEGLGLMLKRQVEASL